MTFREFFAVFVKNGPSVVARRTMVVIVVDLQSKEVDQIVDKSRKELHIRFDHYLLHDPSLPRRPFPQAIPHHRGCY